jgi:hypothetical protein
MLNALPAASAKAAAAVAAEQSTPLLWKRQPRRSLNLLVLHGCGCGSC